MALILATDTFVSVEDADAYFAGRLYASTWEDADTEDREKALRMAAGILDREAYLGAITSTTQALSWPRQGVYDAEGRAIGNTTIPSAIQAAQCELALRLLSEDLTEDDSNKGVQAIQAGSVRLEYDGCAPAKTLPDTVRALLKPFLKSEDGSSARLVF
ncbi:DnaT-like ssDNA-binding protein [Magnetospirillum fulvum]|uniref:Putative DnaT-like domain-containing protein n=1 Tax=Magnetospirillum fulvum MGU-K5 TaxID=1316936 RepID=S9S3Y5_MAGFU|nr:DnaT-like ssDNA-binding protein [Magnetospirillum fulvum]EPY00607.1 hypothetical protein K678_15169 [Magnetospirillum fulvum MGU-K5]